MSLAYLFNAACLRYFSSALFLLVCVNISSCANYENALRDYIKQPDPAYQYHLVKTVHNNGYTTHLISMDSQRWLVKGKVNRTLWTHWMSIVIPDKVITDTVMLIVTGGNNKPAPPDLANDKFLSAVYMAQKTGSIVVVLKQVPNQPLVFDNSTKPLREDRLVAYSWKKAMDTKDFSWPAYLPMVKSVVRAMDTIQAFVPEHSSNKVGRFVVSGFSKRGATTWLTAAIDPRVTAIAPGVFDVLNFEPSLKHHFTSYGFYSDAIEEYVENGVIDRLSTPEGQALQKIVDPYHYIKQLDMPIFILNSAGDEFFPADSARFYFNDLPRDRLIRYVPNTDHSLKESGIGIKGAINSLVAWYQTILMKKKRPTIRWRQQNKKLVVTTDQTPVNIKLWQTTNTTARDFRLETTGKTWKSTPLAVKSSGEYSVEVAPPEKGWTAYFIELQYASSHITQTYTTRVFITPERYKE